MPTPSRSRPFGEDVHHRAVLGHVNRVLERQQMHRGAELEPLGHRRERTQHGPLRRQVAVGHHVVLGQEYPVEPGLLGHLRRLERLLPAVPDVLGVGRILNAKQQTKLHRSPRVWWAQLMANGWSVGTGRIRTDPPTLARASGIVDRRAARPHTAATLKAIV